jgi:hypothetical protein
MAHWRTDVGLLHRQKNHCFSVLQVSSILLSKRLSIYSYRCLSSEIKLKDRRIEL